MLDDLDKELGQRGHKSVRYADANIHVRSQRAREHALESVKGLTEDWPKLKANATETAVNRPWRWRFLEFSFGAERDARSRVAPKTIERFMDNARVLTSRSKSRTMGKRMEALNMHLRRWGRILQAGRYPNRLRATRKTDSKAAANVSAYAYAMEETSHEGGQALYSPVSRNSGLATLATPERATRILPMLLT